MPCDGVRWDQTTCDAVTRLVWWVAFSIAPQNCHVGPKKLWNWIEISLDLTDYGGGSGEDRDLSRRDSPHLRFWLVLGNHWGRLPSLQCTVESEVFLLHNFIVGGYCGRPASGVLPAVHDGCVGHRADRRPSPCPLWARAVRQIHICNPGGSVGHLTNKVIHFDHNHVHWSISPPRNRFKWIKNPSGRQRMRY